MPTGSYPYFFNTKATIKKFFNPEFNVEYESTNELKLFG